MCVRVCARVCACECMLGVSIISVVEEIEAGCRNLSCSIFLQPGPHSLTPPCQQCISLPLFLTDNEVSKKIISSLEYFYPGVAGIVQ